MSRVLVTGAAVRPRRRAASRALRRPRRPGARHRPVEPTRRHLAPTTRWCTCGSTSPPRTTGRRPGDWVERAVGRPRRAGQQRRGRGRRPHRRRSIEDWEWIVEINLFGVVRGTRAFVPMFKAAGLRPRSSTSRRWPGWCTRRDGLVQRGQGRASWRSPRPLAHELAPYGVALHGRLPVVLPDQPDGIDCAARTTPIGGADRAGWSTKSRRLTADDIAAARPRRASTRGDGR